MSAAFQANADPAPAPEPEAAAQEGAKPKDEKDATKLDVVVVTGIGASLARSLEVKRDAINRVEVVTSEDVGKMPDKNVADSLQRVSGVTISSASASEGGFDEADRVSLRGTNPSLTLTQIDGHSVGSGDWFVLNQVGTVGRSVSYTLLPSELVSQIVVHKSSTADLVEGGVAGTVDIQTRRPLYFAQQFTALAEGRRRVRRPAGQDRPAVQRPAQLEERRQHVRLHDPGLLRGAPPQARRPGNARLRPHRPGQCGREFEPFAFGRAVPERDRFALFEQERKRTGGMIDFQFKADRRPRRSTSAGSSRSSTPPTTTAIT
jgi:iron complex outermembrane receptor protein